MSDINPQPLTPAPGESPGNPTLPRGATDQHISDSTTLDTGHRTLDTPPGETLYALLAEFHDVDSIMDAAAKVREAGFTHWDVHTPFPVHGMDKAMGIRPTILPWITLLHGIAGLVGGLALVWYTNAIALPGVPANLQGYPYLISGKPIFSLPANIPIIFETTVLLAAIGTVVGMFALNGLPMHYHPLFRSYRFRRVTSDRFFVVIQADDPKFNLQETTRFLESLGAKAVESVTEEPAD